ncbi:MAG: xylulokinase [Armatimonadota bacterium]
MPLYLTFDIGTTALKTALIDDGGRLLAIHTAEYTPLNPRPEWSEMVPDAYWQATVEGARAVFAQARVKSDELAAIGFSSQGQTYVPIDAAGNALYNAIVWVDNRAQAIADEWEAAWLSDEEFHRISGYATIPAALTVFKVAWMAQHAPAAHKAAKFLCLPDYLTYRMTGESATDYVTARMAGFLDLQTGKYEPRLVAAAGITEEQLPVVLPPGSVAGRVHAKAAAELGIPAGVPVCVGANDQLVGAVGAGNVRPGIITETTGTALALIATTPTLIDDPRIVAGQHAVPELCYAMAYNITSAIVLKWFRDLSAPGESYGAFRSGAEAIAPGSDGLTVLPHFAGTTQPTLNLDVRGAIFGLTLAHTRDHITRAIMESCACMLQECVEPVLDHQLAVTRVRSMGGAAHSDAWLQMKADMLGIPVERPACSDAASLGAAMLAAAGIGRFTSIIDAADAWYRPAQCFEPNPERYAIYREVYGRYKELYAKLYGGVAVGK